ncbi:MAG: hypothetical protein RBU37_10010 [Myxococcota bacterium]|jgi:hypothetical protein|nr:hypothetical protein [Myxococcota bacterium]
MAAVARINKRQADALSQEAFRQRYAGVTFSDEVVERMMVSCQLIENGWLYQVLVFPPEPVAPEVCATPVVDIRVTRAGEVDVEEVAPVPW